MKATPNNYKGGKVGKAHPRFKIVVGDIDFVRDLLQYHYLPHRPATFAVVVAMIDTKNGKPVAALIVSYPVLRCRLREEIFGRLDAKTLNKHFRQITRLVVHPKYREHGLAERMLRFVIRTMDIPVIEALNRSFVPQQLFHRVGMLSRSDEHRNYYYKVC